MLKFGITLWKISCWFGIIITLIDFILVNIIVILLYFCQIFVVL